MQVIKYLPWDILSSNKKPSVRSLAIFRPGLEISMFMERTGKKVCRALSGMTKAVAGGNTLAGTWTSFLPHTSSFHTAPWTQQTRLKKPALFCDQKHNKKWPLPGPPIELLRFSAQNRKTASVPTWPFPPPYTPPWVDVSLFKLVHNWKQLLFHRWLQVLIFFGKHAKLTEFV